MNSNDIEKLYEAVRNRDVGDFPIDRSFILKLLGAPEICINDDLEALKFLLEVRTTLICAKNVSLGNVYRFNPKDSSDNLEPVA